MLQDIGGSAPPREARPPGARGVDRHHGRTIGGRAGRRGGGRRLYTATLGLIAGRSALLVFHASLATSEAVVRRRLTRRVGAFGAALSRIVPGYDADDVIARTIVTPRLARRLCEVEADPVGEVARGFHVHHVERIGLVS